jgi:cell fate regulator YaaT (PSP1 superfamily)
MNTFDWLSQLDIPDPSSYDVVEVSFKHGTRKAFYRNPLHLQTGTGDMVVVESNTGYDVGRISLSGELVRLQMRKKKTRDNQVVYNVIRLANQRDLDRLTEARDQEMPTMVRARAISASLRLNMKISEVEYQGDKRKATFYYTAEGRVDFRELIRLLAGEFRVKVEMRQIGARQESGLVGGIGPCGRELCCSTWLTDFKSVNTAAARYQNLAINQAKLSGQCGRLKCCLNYELDTYLEALGEFPQNTERLRTGEGMASLVKTDIFKGLMYYAYDRDHGRGRIYPLDKDRVREFVEMNIRGEYPVSLAAEQVVQATNEDEHGFDDEVTGVVELPPDARRKKKRGKKPAAGGRPPQASNQPKPPGAGRRRDDRSRPPKPKP